MNEYIEEPWPFNIVFVCLALEHDGRRRLGPGESRYDPVGTSMVDVMPPPRLVGFVWHSVQYDARNQTFKLILCMFTFWHKAGAKIAIAKTAQHHQAHYYRRFSRNSH